MTLCKLIEMNLPNGLVASIEGNSKEEVLADIVEWLDRFYRRESKVFGREGKKTSGKEKWAYEVQKNGRSVGSVKVEYFRQFEGAEGGRRIRRQRFGIYFDTKNGHPNGADRDNFLKYLRTFVVETPRQGAPSPYTTGTRHY